jgi:hypothetical protein
MALGFARATTDETHSLRLHDQKLRTLHSFLNMIL